MATEKVRPDTRSAKPRRGVVQELDQLVHALTVCVLNSRGYAVGDNDSVDESVDRLIDFVDRYERAEALRRGG